MARHDDDDDDDDSERVKLRAPPDFDGPLEDRYCTDVLLLLLLLGMWVAMTGVGLYAVEEGDYRKIVFPLDYDGNICGTDFGALDMTDYPLLYYVNSYTGGVCVKECPDVSKSLADNGIDVPQGTVTDVRTLITYGGLYQVEGSTLPADFIQIGDYSNSSDAVDCTPELCFPDPNDPTSSWTAPGISRGFGIAYYAGDTYELLYRCYYTIAAEDQIAEQVVASGEDGGGLDPMNKANDFFNDLYGDLYVARQYIAGFGLGLCLGVSFIYIFLMRIPLLLKTLVWTSILLTTALFLIGGYYTYNLAQDWEDEDPQTVDDTTITVSCWGCCWGGVDCVQPPTPGSIHANAILVVCSARSASKSISVRFHRRFFDNFTGDSYCRHCLVCDWWHFDTLGLLFATPNCNCHWLCQNGREGRQSHVSHAAHPRLASHWYVCLYGRLGLLCRQFGQLGRHYHHRTRFAWYRFSPSGRATIRMVSLCRSMWLVLVVLSLLDGQFHCRHGRFNDCHECRQVLLYAQQVESG